MIRFIILGLMQGSIFGLLALGIVLVYKGSRVFNFAQAEFGTLAAFFTYFLHQVAPLPYPFAALGALILTGGVGWLMERIVVRPLFDAPKVTLLVATAGVALLALALELKIGGAVQRPIDAALAGKSFTFVTAQVTPQQVFSVVIVIALAAALAYFFRKTDLGLAILALSQEPVATELTGIGARRMSSFVWVFAAVLGGIAGIVQSGISRVIYPGFMTLNYLLLGFTSAVIGGITSLAGAFVGGVLVGVLYNIGSYVDSNYIHHAIPGFASLVVFVALMTILLVRPKGLLGAEA